MGDDLNQRAGKALAGRWRERMGVRAILEDGTVEPVVGTVVGFLESLPIVWWPDLNGTRAHHPTAHLQPAMECPATRGAYLAVVREAWGDTTIHVRCGPSPESWSAWHTDTTTGGGGFVMRREGRFECPISAASEAEVLVAALEASNVRTA